MKFGIAGGADFLDPGQAFRLRVSLGTDRQVSLHWDIAKGYKLYRDGVKVSVAKGDGRTQRLPMPKGITVVDPSSGEKIEIYHDRLDIVVPVVKPEGKFTLKVEYQGCADDGLCYPPTSREYAIDPAVPGLLKAKGELASSDTEAAAVKESPSAAIPPPGPETADTGSSQNEFFQVTSTLADGSLWKITIVFLFFGLLLSFTPCVLPMIPILSSIIVGEGSVTRGRGFLMAAAYSLGLAMVYTALGVAAGLAGEGLAGALQKPWVLVLFSVMLVLLSLSMFDVYQLQMPAAIQNRLCQTSGKLKGGKFIGVFVMGALSALIVGPCVAAPLAGTLVYISQTKNVVIGGLALFSMAVGMSVPLLLVGLSAGSLLPKAGTWMVNVKYVFGLLLIAVAIWIVSPLMPPQWLMVAWGGFAILCAVFLRGFDPLPEKSSIAQRFGKAFALVLTVAGVLELAGAASGGKDLLLPLAHLRAFSGSFQEEEDLVMFRRIKTEVELDEVLRSSDRPVMLDFSADWCVSCREMERFTFRDSKVKAELGRFTLLQVDVTSNSEDDRALMKRFGLFGPPGLIFFDMNGREIPQSRVIGFMDAEAFSVHVKTVAAGR